MAYNLGMCPHWESNRRQDLFFSFRLFRGFTFSCGVFGVLLTAYPSPWGWDHLSSCSYYSWRPCIQEASLGCQGGSGSAGTWGLVSVQLPVLPTQSDPLLAGIPRDPDYSVPCYCSSPSSSNLYLLANGKCDKYWGSLRGCSRAGEMGGAGVLWAGPQGALTHLPPGASLDKTLDCTTHWSRTPEPETLGPAASENTVTSIDWKRGRDSGPRSNGSPPLPNSDSSQEHCNDQELVKRRQSITKVTPTRETPSCCAAIYCCGA